MFRLLLLIAAACQVALAADINPCHEGLACLYFARCTEPHAGGQENVFVTMETSKYYEWKAVNCTSNQASTAELFIEPINNRIWKGTFRSKAGKIVFDRLSISYTNVERINPYDPDINTIVGPKEIDNSPFTSWFKIDSIDQTKLSDIFADTDIKYYEEGMKDGGATTSKQPEFWKKIQELTHDCPGSLISSYANSKLTRDLKNMVKCKIETEKMWLKSDEDYKWKQLDTVICDSNKKTWEAKFNEAVIPTSGALTILCAEKEPELWSTTTSSTSTTTTTPSTTTTPANAAANTTTTTESPESTSKPASSILPSVIIPIIIGGLHLFQ